MISAKEFIEACLPLIEKSWEIIKEVHESPHLKITQWKGKNNAITAADRKSQYIQNKGLNRKFPGLTVIGEEKEQDLLKANLDFLENIDAKININNFDGIRYPIKNCTVWIDPQDGTYEFQKGNVEHVTILIGLAVDDNPTIGLISTGYEKNQFKPKVYVGEISVKENFVFDLGHNKERIYNSVENIKPFKEVNNYKTWRLITSMDNRYSYEERKLFEAFGNVEICEHPGIGYKIIRILKGLNDGYLKSNKGPCKWDTIAGEVLLKCIGGTFSGVKGEIYKYGKNEKYENEYGSFALNNEIFHKYLLEKVVTTPKL